MNYFDRLQTRSPLTTRQVFAPIGQTLPSVGETSLFPQRLSSQPIIVAEQPPIMVGDAPNPFAGPDASAPAPVQPANPVAGLSKPTLDQNPFAGPAQAPEPVPVGNSTVELSPELADKAERLRSDYQQMMDAGATREQLAARLAQDGFTTTDVQGFEEALAYREKHPGSASRVGLYTREAEQPETYHGADEGALQSFASGALDAMTFGSADEIGGAIGATVNSVGNAIGVGDGSAWTDYYTRLRDQNRQRLEDDSHFHGGAHLGGQVVGGLATAAIGGGEAALARGGWSAAGRLAGEGAAFGGAYGFNSGQGSVGDRVREGLKGAALGAVGGVALGMPVNAIARRIVPSSMNSGRAVLDAADHLNAKYAPAAPIRPLIGHTSDGGVGSMAHGLMEPTLIGGKLSGLQKATALYENQTGGMARAIADREAGGASEAIVDVAGRVANPNVRGSLGAYGQESEAAARSVYNAAETAAGGAQVPTPATVARIDAILKEWDAVPGGVPGAETLRSLRKQLMHGPDGKSLSASWTIDGLRRLRTSFGDNIESNQRQLKEAANRIWPELSQDIFRGLRVAGKKDAARLYREADRAWARHVENVEVINRVIGKDQNLSPDQVADRLVKMAAKDYDHLATALDNIDPRYAGEIRGGLINHLGKPLASQQSQAGEFSIQSFATRWNQLSTASKKAVWGNRDVVDDLDRLASLAMRKRGIDRYGNPSKSGIYLENWNQTKNLIEVSAATGGLAAATPAAIAAIGGMVSGGLVLGTPRIARMLVRLTEDRWAGGRLPKWAARTIRAASTRYPAAAQDLARLRDNLEGVPAHAAAVPGEAAGVVDPDSARHADETGRVPLPDGEFIDLD